MAEGFSALQRRSCSDLRKVDKFICEGFRILHIADKNAIGFLQMKRHYDPDKFI